MITSFRMYNAVPRAAQAWRALFERVFADAGCRRPHHRARLAGPDRRAVARARAVLRLHVRLAVRALGRRDAGDRRTGALAAAVRRPAALLQRIPGARGERLAFARGDVRPSLRLDGGELAVGLQRSARASREVRRHRNAPRSMPRFTGRWGRPRKRSRRCVPATWTWSRWTASSSIFAGITSLRSSPALRCVATTPWTPIPLLVAAPGLDEALVARLRRHLLGHRHAAVICALAGRRVARAVRGARRDVVSCTRIDGARGDRNRVRDDSMKSPPSLFVPAGRAGTQ